MKNVIKNYTVGSLACMIAGVILLIDPHIITNILNSVIGILLIVGGALGTVGFIVAKSRNDGGASIISLLGSLALVFCGIVVFSHKNLLETLLMFALGIFLISSGVPKIIAASELRNHGADGWTAPFVTSCISTLLGIVIIISPALLPGIFMRVAGALLLVGGIGNFIGGHTEGKMKTALSNVEKNREYRRGKAGTQSGEIIDINNYED